MRTIAGGFESIMIDGSMSELDTNIALTKKVVDKARNLGICIEGEIGHVGSAIADDNSNINLYTKAEDAERFCRNRSEFFSRFNW